MTNNITHQPTAKCARCGLLHIISKDGKNITASCVGCCRRVCVRDMERGKNIDEQRKFESAERCCGTCLYRRKCNRHSICTIKGGKIVGYFDCCDNGYVAADVRGNDCE